MPPPSTVTKNVAAGRFMKCYAFGIQFGGNSDDPMPRKIGADAWFDRWDAERFEVHEQTMRTGSEETLTLVLVSDPQMLEE